MQLSFHYKVSVPLIGIGKKILSLSKTQHKEVFINYNAEASHIKISKIFPLFTLMSGFHQESKTGETRVSTKNQKQGNNNVRYPPRIKNRGTINYRTNTNTNPNSFQD
ncbi:hypothetical protein ACJW30_02G113800 [Castanea mollissima]